MEYTGTMITTVTGKNQITIPAAIANRIGLKSGSRIDWQLSSKSDEIRCIVLPEPSVIAANLRGAGKRFLKPGQNPSAALLAERTTDESIRSTHLK
jgi:AbrB family looped-hinge helix DNA binding protein